MRRIKLVVAYDGTRYCGFQFQKNGPTIEAELNRTLLELTGEEIHVMGASRTDAGVHALGNIAVFNTQSRIPVEKFSYALNSRLPKDIVVQSSEEVPASYHPRKCNSLKTYEYRILNRQFPDPSRRLNCCFCHWSLDTEQMQKAAACLVGEHDFASFCSAGSQAEDTVRRLYEVSVRREGELVTIRLVGNGFLYNMVRIIAGTLMSIGQGTFPAEHMKEILNARDRRAAGVKAPANGLTLISITPAGEPKEYERYTNDWIDYCVDRSALWTKGQVTMIIHRCLEEERERMIAHVRKQAFWDGAKEFLVKTAEIQEKMD
ncbi:MAG: tRNA pseudouridine(38-40) synthase TruA [Lachnospiraceae bacterium]|jgi:tRNA pseudouridine38-40 synthase|nr:tRNA pseudouridine(38-40) synthase TruA [Lachnospiraceae bacterium]